MLAGLVDGGGDRRRARRGPRRRHASRTRWRRSIRVSQARRSRWGSIPTLPPVMYRDPNNPSKIIGQDPDMVDAAMKCLGLKYELVGLDFGTLIPTLQAGQIQLVWSNIYYTPVRAQAADFVIYATTGTAGIVKKGNPKGDQEPRRHVRHARRAHPRHGGGSGLQGPERQMRGGGEARHRDHAVPECAGDLARHRERPGRRVDVRPRARRPGREEQSRQVRARVLGRGPTSRSAWR